MDRGKSFRLAFVCLAVGVIATRAAAQTLKINEIMYDTTGSEASNEWIEFYVMAGGDVNPFFFTTRDGETAFNFPSLTVSAGEFIVLHIGSGTNDLVGPTYHLYWDQSAQRFNNNGDDANLCTSSTCSAGTCADYVAYESGNAIDAPTGGCSWDGGCPTCGANPASSVAGTTIAQGPDGADGNTVATWEEAGAAGGPTTFGPSTQGLSNSSDPTPVRFRGAQVRWDRGGALIEWQTASEINEAGFVVLRDRPGAEDLAPIPGGRRPSLGAGRGTSYAVFDSEAQPGDRYVLRAIGIDGGITDFAPLAARAMAPLPRGLDDDWARLDVEPAILADRPPARFWPGDVVRIVAPANHLVAVDLPAGIAGQMPLSLERQGQAVPFWYAGDRIVFYAPPQLDVRREGIVYLLHVGATGAASAQTLAARPASGKALDRTTVVDRVTNATYYYGVSSPEAEDAFYWDFVATDTPLQGLPLSLRSAVGGRLRLRLAVEGVVDNPNVIDDHHLLASVNGQPVLDVRFSDRERRVFEVEVDQPIVGSGSLSLDLTLADDTGLAYDLAFLDWVELEYEAKIEARDGEAYFSAPAGERVSVGGLPAGQVWLLDVTDSDAPVRLVANATVMAVGADLGLAASALKNEDDGAEENSLNDAYSGCSCALGAAPLGISRASYVPTFQTFDFTHAGVIGMRRYVAATKLTAPLSVGLAQSGRVLREERGADWIAIVDPLLLDATLTLAAVHAEAGLETWVVGMDEVADGFGFGEATPEAMRAFLEDGAARWQVQPRFVTLVGQASFDPLGAVGGTTPDRVPVQRSPMATWRFHAADDGWIVQNLADPPAVGRLPAASSEEIEAVAAKIRLRGSSAARRALLVTDSGFEAEEGLVAEALAGRLSTETIREADGQNPGERVVEAFNSSPGLAIYVGHAYQRGWGLFFTQEQAASIEAPAGLVLSLDCFDGMFDDAFGPALASTLVGSEGGPVAVFAPSAIGGVHEHRVLARAVFDELLASNEDRHATVGEALQAAKARVLVDAAPALREVTQSYNLIGDPATPMAALWP